MSDTVPSSTPSSTSRPSPSAIWCAIPLHDRRRRSSIPVLDYDHRIGKASTRFGRRVLAKARRAGHQDRLGAGDPRPRRPPVRRRPTSRLKTGAKVGDRRAHPRRAAHLPAGVQRHRRERRRPRVRPPVQGRRALPARQRSRSRSCYTAGPYAGRRRLPDRRCGVRRRHDVHAGLRHRARRLPRRRCAHSSTARSSASWRCRRETRLFMCHDYKAPGRDHYAWETTVGEERAHNVHVHDGVSETEFVAMRTTRDADARGAGAAAAVDPGQHPRRTLSPARLRTASAICAFPCGSLPDSRVAELASCIALR